MPPRMRIAAGEIRLWHVSFTRLVGDLARLYSMLSAEEKTRAQRFFFEKDQNRYIILHGVLRQLIALYTGAPPGGIQFCRTSRGKPRLDRRRDGAALEFSISRSHDTAIFAFALNRQIGADVEYVTEMPGMQGVAGTFLSASEHAVFRALPERAQQAAFFDSWTCKEALLKATGEGLSRPMQTVEVDVSTQDRPRMLKLNGDAAQARRWALFAFEPRPHYAACVAVERGDVQLKINEWNVAGPCGSRMAGQRAPAISKR